MRKLVEMKFASTALSMGNAKKQLFSKNCKVGNSGARIEGQE